MKILDVTYASTGKDSNYHEIGDVTVSFSNGRVAVFDNVHRDSFKWWGDGGFDPRHVPYEMTFAFQPWLVRLRGHEMGEETPDDEPMNERIRDDDHLGQATGFPTPGFEPDDD